MNILNCLIIVTSFLFVSCATEKPEGKTEAEVLYKEAVKFEKEERYLVALDKINLLRMNYPYSFYAIPSELLRAEIFFKQENYIEATEAFMTFKDFHPKHEKISYILWMIAESNFHQVPESIDRDISSAIDAIVSYREVIKKFPASEYAKRSRERIQTCYELVDKKELYIADFYYRTKNYQSASYRFSDLFEKTKNLDLKKNNYMKLIHSLLEIKDYKKCKSALESGFANRFVTEQKYMYYKKECNLVN